MGKFDYENLPKCQECSLFEKGDDRTRCALYWRPGTGTKCGYPDKSGWECPRSSVTEHNKMPIDELRMMAKAYFGMFIPNVAGDNQ